MNMKNSFTILFILIFSSSFAFAQELNKLMETGNEFYQNKQYNEAIESYETILKQGYLSTDLYYNIGNAYFKIGEIGKAILYYERALKVSPNNEDAAYNLKIVNARTVDKIQEISPLFFVKWWNVLLTSFTSTGWQIIIFIFYILLLTCIGLYFLIKNIQVQKFAFIFGTLNIAALIISMILFFSSLARESTSDYGILLKSVTTTKIAPDAQSSDAFVIHEGIKFLIEDKVNNWVKIRLRDGKVGWLLENSFDLI